MKTLPVLVGRLVGTEHLGAAQRRRTAPKSSGSRRPEAIRPRGNLRELDVRIEVPAICGAAALRPSRRTQRARRASTAAQQEDGRTQRWRRQPRQPILASSAVHPRSLHRALHGIRFRASARRGLPVARGLVKAASSSSSGTPNSSSIAIDVALAFADDVVELPLPQVVALAHAHGDAEDEAVRPSRPRAAGTTVSFSPPLLAK